jgi:hypothetical protein
MSATNRPRSGAPHFGQGGMAPADPQLNQIGTFDKSAPTPINQPIDLSGETITLERPDIASLNSDAIRDGASHFRCSASRNGTSG